MECVNCDCTVKTMDNLEKAIRALLQRGKHVNRMMDNEKLICEAKKMEEVEQLKRQLPKAPILHCAEISTDPTMTNTDKPCRIYNKQLGCAESIDFDVPSLPIESSSQDKTDEKTGIEMSGPHTTASLSIPKKTGEYTKSQTTTCISKVTEATFQKSSSSSKSGVCGGGALVLDNQYVVDKDGNMVILPMKVYVKQNLVDESLDLQLVFFDENSQKVMDISMTMHENKIRDVQFCGKDAKLVS